MNTFQKCMSTALCAAILPMMVFAKTRFMTTIVNGNCGNGNRWQTIIVVDRYSGKPVSASGVDCEGKSWSKQYQLINVTSPDTLDTDQSDISIHDLSTDILTINTNRSGIAQICNMQTGEFVGSPITIPLANSYVSIPIDSLTSGLYIILFQDSLGGGDYEQFIK